MCELVARRKCVRIFVLKKSPSPAPSSVLNFILFIYIIPRKVIRPEPQQKCQHNPPVILSPCGKIIFCILIESARARRTIFACPCRQRSIYLDWWSQLKWRGHANTVYIRDLIDHYPESGFSAPWFDSIRIRKSTTTPRTIYNRERI